MTSRKETKNKNNKNRNNTNQDNERNHMHNSNTPNDDGENAQTTTSSRNANHVAETDANTQPPNMFVYSHTISTENTTTHTMQPTNHANDAQEADTAGQHETFKQSLEKHKQYNKVIVKTHFQKTPETFKQALCRHNTQ